MGMFIPSQAPDKDEAYQFMDYILQPENAAKCFDYIGYYSTNKAADSLLENQDLVVPDSVTEGSAVENISAEAEEATIRTGQSSKLPATDKIRGKQDGNL